MAVNDADLRILEAKLDRLTEAINRVAEAAERRDASIKVPDGYVAELRPMTDAERELWQRIRPPKQSEKPRNDKERTDLGWVSLPTEEFERLNAEIRSLNAECDEYQAKLNTVWAEVQRLHGEVDRLSRALSHA